jgi:predicted ATPase
MEGEHVYRLDPLASPPDDSKLTAAIAQTFPATQLFMERAAASGARLDFGDAEAAISADICRSRGGVARRRSRRDPDRNRLTVDRE